MGFGRFEIVIENRNGIFYPGQSVNGTVHVTNSKVESLKGIKLIVTKFVSTFCQMKNIGRNSNRMLRLGRGSYSREK
jgi:sporulation-control protein spo0M